MLFNWFCPDVLSWLFNLIFHFFHLFYLCFLSCITTVLPPAFVKNNVNSQQRSYTGLLCNEEGAPCNNNTVTAHWSLLEYFPSVYLFSQNVRVQGQQQDSILQLVETSIRSLPEDEASVCLCIHTYTTQRYTHSLKHLKDQERENKINWNRIKLYKSNTNWSNKVKAFLCMLTDIYVRHMFSFWTFNHFINILISKCQTYWAYTR